MFSKRWVSTTTLRGDGTVAKGANAVAAGAADAAVAMPARCADTARRAPTTRFGKDSVDSGTMLEPPGLDESACLASWPLRVSSTSALAQQLQLEEEERDAAERAQTEGDAEMARELAGLHLPKAAAPPPPKPPPPPPPPLRSARGDAARCRAATRRRRPTARPNMMQPYVLQAATPCTRSATLCLQEPDYEDEDTEQAEREEKVRPPHALRTASPRPLHALYTPSARPLHALCMPSAPRPMRIFCTPTLTFTLTLALAPILAPTLDLRRRRSSRVPS